MVSKLKDAALILGHNIIGFDCLVLDRFFPGCINRDIVADTLVLSRLLKYQLDDGEGHSLEAWGNRLGFPKHDKPDFTRNSDELQAYCMQDVQSTHALYCYLQQHLAEPGWHRAIDVEHEIAWLCVQMQRDGFSFEVDRARALRYELEDKLHGLDKDIGAAFLPKLYPVREITPRLTKHGTISKANLPRDWTDYTLLHAGCPFVYCVAEEFNPGSPSQIVERLDGLWDPTVRTKSGKSFKICEENLATLKETAPEAAKKLVERLLLASRVRTLDEWMENEVSGRIHCKFNPIGTWTGRMSHVKPNLGNVAAPKSIKYKGRYLARLATDLGGTMRSLWTSSPGWWLVGVDAESIQLRILAHYIDDPIFTEALVNGKKELGTDPHSLNAKILEVDRDTSKTFIFAFLLGAGIPKIGDILGCSRVWAVERKEHFISSYPGLKTLKGEYIPRAARRGYFEGLDGRRVHCVDEHLMLAAMLQNGEAVIMKHANILWRKQLEEAKITFRQLNFVHDEWQTECRGERSIGERVGRIQAHAIYETGRALGLKCPLSGSYRVGKNWLETH